MKKSTFLIVFFVMSSLSSQEINPSSLQRVDKILANLTLKEKIGQMTQLNIDVVSKGEIYKLNEPHELDIKKLEKAIIEYGVGSILNAGSHAYALEHWQTIISQIQDMATNKTRTKIPVLYGIDAIHGAGYLSNGTLFPQPLAQAATFNPQLVATGAAITAYETRACGISWNFSPVLDLARQPLWSRFFETYGEDVYLCKQMGLAAVYGYQGYTPNNPYKVGACLKHFLGYSNPVTGKDRTSVSMNEVTMREYYLPTFQAAMSAGALSIMINSGDLNGSPVHADYNILTTLLRKNLQFDGVAVTDWEDIMKLQNPHKVAASLKDAVKIAINAGVDMSMVPNDYRFSDLLLELVNEGEVPISRIDESVRRILLMKERLGLFEQAFSPSSMQYPLVASDSFIHASYLTAAESITLLKNAKGILPLSTNSKIMITGPMANSLSFLNGAWSRTWQGLDSQWNDETKQTIYEAITSLNKSVDFHKGSNNKKYITDKCAQKMAKKNDIIIACLGELPSTEKPGDINSLDLEETQIQYLKELHKSGKPIILILVENRPRIIREIEPLCQAIIMAYQPSENGAQALADIIFGKINPSGRLPMTYPRYTNTLLTYDHKYTDRLAPDFSETGFDPQWEFGHGLSYTSYNYTNFKIDKTTVKATDTITISIDVSNTGKIDGKETVLVYISDEVASLTPPVKRLRAFDKKTIKVGQSVTYSFKIPISDLAFVNNDLVWRTEPGKYTIKIAGISKTIELIK
jgi:beta-glucosidase